MKTILLVLLVSLLAGCSTKPAPVKVYPLRDTTRIGAADAYAHSMGK